MAVTIKDEKDGIVSVLTDETFDFRDLKPGSAEAPPVRRIESEFTAGRIAPTTKPGNYGVYISVGQRDGTPRIALPLAGDDGQRRYRLGEIRLRQG